MHSPLPTYLKTAFKILRYFKGCPGLGIHIARTFGMFLNASTDANWAKCIVTRKSVTRYYVFLNNSLVSWKSKKQNTLSKSSTKAEYRALASVTSEVIWILNFLKDLQIEKLLSVSLHCDSVVKTVKVDSANQIADILIKGLDTVQHLKLVKRLGFSQGLVAFDQRLKDEGLLLLRVDSYKSVWSRCYKSYFSSFDLHF
ncbi:hypothetical protein Tco_0333355 [Tanacetum coccineum]